MPLAGIASLGGTALAAPSHHAATVTYQVPPAAPTGNVHVLSMGIAELPVPSSIGSEPHVHVRLAAANRHDDRDWHLDPREQVLRFGDGSAALPRFAELSDGQSGRLRVARGQRGYVDLFYPVGDANPFWTSLDWVVRRGAGRIVATTVWELLPGPQDIYSHYRPSHYQGGTLYIGHLWCSPLWSHEAHWHGRYRGYWGHHYAGRHHGFDVSTRRTRWRYRRGDDESRPRETVGTRWRGWSPEPAIARPAAPAGPAGPPVRSTPWRVQIERLDGFTSRRGPSDRHDSEGPSGSTRWTNSSSFGARPTPPPDRSPSPEPPSSPPASSTPAPSGGDSVGSRWRR